MQLTILIPFHREETILIDTLTALYSNLNIPHEVLLIHDEDNDPTLPLIKEFQGQHPKVKAILNRHSPGIPGAIKTGIDQSQGDLILFLVADDAGATRLITPMVNALNQGYDLVSATRYSKGGRLESTTSAMMLSKAGNRIFQTLTASPLSDATCGIKMFRKGILKVIDLKSSSDWTLAFELAVKAQYYGFKVTEVPFVSYNRSGHHSHFKLWPRTLRYLGILIWGVFKLWAKPLCKKTY